MGGTRARSPGINLRSSSERARIRPRPSCRESVGRGARGRSPNRPTDPARADAAPARRPRRSPRPGRSEALAEPDRILVRVSADLRVELRELDRMTTRMPEGERLEPTVGGGAEHPWKRPDRELLVEDFRPCQLEGVAVVLDPGDPPPNRSQGPPASPKWRTPSAIRINTAATTTAAAAPTIPRIN